MAELLIYNKQSNQHSLGYKRGDVVEIRENGYWIKGRGYNRSVFIVIQITDMTIDQAKKYIDMEWKGREIIKRRYWQLNIDDIPKKIKNTIQADRFYITAKKDISAYLRNKNG